MSNFKTGDRVKYTGWFTEDLRDEVGTVQVVINEDNVTVDWDTDRAKEVGVHTVMSENISILSTSPMDIVDKYHEDKKDPVAKPAHYNIGTIECIEYLKDNMPKEAFIGYLEGNVKKYLHRWRYKVKPTEDLKKAQWYLDRLIKEVDIA